LKGTVQKRLYRYVNLKSIENEKKIRISDDSWMNIWDKLKNEAKRNQKFLEIERNEGFLNGTEGFLNSEGVKNIFNNLGITSCNLTSEEINECIKEILSNKTKDFLNETEYILNSEKSNITFGNLNTTPRSENEDFKEIFLNSEGVKVASRNLNSVFDCVDSKEVKGNERNQEFPTREENELLVGRIDNSIEKKHVGLVNTCKLFLIKYVEKVKIIFNNIGQKFSKSNLKTYYYRKIKN
jgi:hypothetical protein